VKGRAQPGLDLYLGCYRTASVASGIKKLPETSADSLSLSLPLAALYSSRIDQVVELLSPILIEVLQDHVLLDGRIRLPWASSVFPRLK